MGQVSPLWVRAPKSPRCAGPDIDRNRTGGLYGSWMTTDGAAVKKAIETRNALKLSVVNDRREAFVTLGEPKMPRLGRSRGPG